MIQVYYLRYYAVSTYQYLVHGTLFDLMKQNRSNSPTQARLLSDMEKCSEIVYSLLEVDQKQSEQHSRRHVLSEARLPSSADQTSRHSRKKVAPAQHPPPPAKRQATSNRVATKQNHVPSKKPNDTPTHLSASNSDGTIKSTLTDYTLPQTFSTTSPGDKPVYSSHTSSHLLSLATQRLMQSLAHRLDPTRNTHTSLPLECQALLPQLMAVIQLLDSTNPNPLPLPPPLSSTLYSDVIPQSRPLPLCNSDLKGYTHSVPVRHEVGINTDYSDDVRSEVSKLTSDKLRLSEQCQRLETCLRKLRKNRDQLAHELTQTTRQRDSLSSALQQLKAELNDFEEMNKNYATELEMGNVTYNSSVRSLGESIHLLDPSVHHGAELDSLSVGSHVSETIIAKEAELRRVKGKCGEYKDILLQTHNTLLRTRDSNSYQDICVTEAMRELDNFVKQDRFTDSSAISSFNVRQTPEKLHPMQPVCSTLSNESAFEERLYRLDEQINKLQLNINHSRDQLH